MRAWRTRERRDCSRPCNREEIWCPHDLSEETIDECVGVYTNCGGEEDQDSD